jgi:sec-independent protein translocase protein TatC
MDFLFRVCAYTGIVFSLPVIIYQILKYFEPLMGHKSMKFALFGSAISAFLAMAGMAFGYFAGLPAVLHFLFNQFSPTAEIKPLIAVQSYMSFVTLYMFGAALLFQVPLILLFINRFTRLKPRSLIKNERWFILGSFILAVLMNPTPNPIDQIMLAGPMILMYQVGILLVWLVNRRTKPALATTAAINVESSDVAAELPQAAASTKPSRASRMKPRKRSRKVEELLALDAAIRAEREAKLADAKLIWQEASAIADRPMASVAAIADHRPPKIVDATLTRPKPVSQATPKPTPIPVTVEVETQKRVGPLQERPRRYVDGFSRNRNVHLRP